MKQLPAVSAYCREKSVSELPASPFEGYRAEPIYNISATKVSELPANETKPDPRVLLDIARIENTTVDAVTYIGDSIAKDVLMAKKAGCFSIWAKYGVPLDPPMYQRLVRISHWTEDDIKRERDLAAEASKINPDFVCEKAISQCWRDRDGHSNESAFDLRSIYCRRAIPNQRAPAD